MEKWRGHEVNWSGRSTPSTTYQNFRSYLTMVFGYTGTYSLARELRQQALIDLEMGDVFIRGGSPGHAVIVMDKAVHEATGAVRVLLAQSHMPAQDIHILYNPGNAKLSPWYPVAEFESGVNTPEWRFTQEELKKF